MPNFTLEGTITDSGSCGGAAGVTSIDLGGECGCGSIPAAVSTGFQRRKLTSGVYTALDVGTGKSVTKGLFLYLNAKQAKVRLTTIGLSGDVVAIVPVDGVAIWTFPALSELKLLEVDGQSVEYLVSGNE